MASGGKNAPLIHSRQARMPAPPTIPPCLPVSLSPCLLVSLSPCLLVSPTRPYNAPMHSPAIDLEQIGFRRDDRWILDNLSWQVETGSCAALLGPNGCGKSTLARI